MKKFYLIALFALVCNFASAQIESVAYRGAFAPAPAAMWTDSWTNWSPKTTEYADKATVVNVTTDITVNTTWTADKTYKLTGLIYVRNNATLTIQAGTLVKGVYTSSGTALIVAKGAKLNAIGTAAAPIVFTSGKTVAQGRSAGDWGGVVLLGKARFTSLGAANTGVNYIEGITSSVNTEYGGGSTPDDADNSGTLKYVRIEFGGFVFSNNNEINGLTMGAVGNGTTIDYVQTSYTNDDSFEWFGGSVNCKHLVAYRGLDDDFDTDNGYKGAVQFALGIKDPSIADNPVVSNSEGFESDNNATGVVAQSGWDATSCIFSNCTLIGPSGRGASSIASGHERPLRLRRASQIKIYNSIFQDFKTNYLYIDGSLTQGNATGGTLKFKNNIIAGTANSTYTSGVRGSSATTATAASELSSWFSTNNNSYVASTDILAAPYSASPLTDYTGDFRPGTLAATGASFDDSSLTPFLPQVATGTLPTVTNLSFCKGTTVSAALTATKSSSPATETTQAYTGVSLRWYTDNTTTVFSTTAPTPSTATVGDKNYYVAQVDASGNVSSRVALKVTTLAVPTVGLGLIKGAVDPITSVAAAPTLTVGQYVGTTTQFTYSVATSTDPTKSTYFWSVPSGANIISGQGENTIVVNYLNVPTGAGIVGSITAQVVNAEGCKGAASTLTILKALATAPTLSMYNKASAAPTTALTSFGQFAGTETPVTLVSSTVASATGYKWELPAGVNLVTGLTSPATSTTTYTAEPFLTSASAPTTVGTKYWVVTYKTYTGVDVNGVNTNIVTSTAEQKIAGASAAPKLFTFTIPAGSTAAVGDVFTFGGNTYTVRTALTSTGKSLVCTGANGVGFTLPSSSANTTGTLTKSDLSTINFTIIAITDATTGYEARSAAYAPYGTVIKSNLPSIIVNFAGASASTVNELYLGVKSLNGVGSSVKNNDTTANAVAIAAKVPGITYDVYTETVTAAIPTTVSKPANGGTNANSTYAVTSTTPSTATLLKVVSVTPLAPATLAMNNGSTATAITVISKMIGQGATVKLLAGTSASASSYSWVLPGCVTRVTDLTGANSITGTDALKSNVPYIFVKFNGTNPDAGVIYFGVKAVNNVGSSDSSAANTDITAPGNVGSTFKLLKLVTAVPAAPSALVLNNGDTFVPATDTKPATTKIVPITIISKLIGQGGIYRLSATVPATTLANYFTWELPACVTRVASLTENTVVGGLVSTNPEIFVKFNGSENPAAGVIYFGVKAVNNVGSSNSSTANTLASAPGNVGSTFKLLKLVTAVPAAPATFVMNDLASATPAAAVTDISKYIGEVTELKLTAAVSVLANSYTWYLQDGVNVTSGNTTRIGETNTYTSFSNVITVNFANVPVEPNQAVSLVLGVKAENGVGSSVTINTGANIGRTDKLLTLTGAAPVAVGIVAGSLKICATTASSVAYSIAAVAAKATEYYIEVLGCATCTITAGGETSVPVGSGGGLFIPAVANASFTVNYPAGFIATTTNLKKIVIVSKNNIGFAEKFLTLTNVGAICGGRIAPDEAAVANEFSVVAYPNPSSSEFTIETSAKGAINAKVYDMQGRLVENANSTQVGSSLAPGVYNVIVSQGVNTKSVRVIKK